MASWTGLADKAPGFATVFPEGLNEAWDDTGRGGVDGANDVDFIRIVIGGLVAEGLASPNHVFLVGLSNGAYFAEHLARHGLVKALGIVLVSGTSQEASRRNCVEPNRPCGALLIVGTADRNVPYRGGRASGVAGWLARRRMRSLLLQQVGRESVAPEVVPADWARANGCVIDPIVERLGSNPDDLQVAKQSWSVDQDALGQRLNPAERAARGELPTGPPKTTSRTTRLPGGGWWRKPSGSAPNPLP